MDATTAQFYRGSLASKVFQGFLLFNFYIFYVDTVLLTLY